MFKFKKKLLFKIEDGEIIDFCRILGKHGLEFKISQEHAQDVLCNDGRNRRVFYRVFAVYVTKAQSRALSKDLNTNDESVFESR